MGRKNLYNVFLIIFSGLFISIFVYELWCQKFEIPIAVFAAFITAAITYMNYSIENDKLFKTIFTEYNSKYDIKFNDALNLITDDTILDNINKGLVNDYFNFAAEEYLWYKRGRVPDDVWKAWEAGIRFHLNKKPIRLLWSDEVNQKASYYGLVEKLNPALT